MSRRIGFVVAAVLMFNFIGTHISFGDRFGRALYDEIPPTVSFLKNKAKHNKLEDAYRVFSFLEGRVESEILEDIYANSPPALPSFQLYSATLVPSRNLKYGVESAGYNATITNFAMARLVGYIGGQASQKELNQIRDANVSLSQKSHLFTQRHPIISLLGISHIISAYPLDESVFPKVFETTVTSHNIPVYIYENKQARPLYYFTEETELLDLPNTTTPQELQTIIESMNLQAGSWQATTQEGITLQSRGNTRLTLKTKTTKPTILVHSQNNLPGWRVFIDNERIELYTFATVYQAIRIPSGEHEIRFEYSYGEMWRYFIQSKLKITN